MSIFMQNMSSLWCWLELFFNLVGVFSYWYLVVASWLFFLLLLISFLGMISIFCFEAFWQWRSLNVWAVELLVALFLEERICLYVVVFLLVCKECEALSVLVELDENILKMICCSVRVDWMVNSSSVLEIVYELVWLEFRSFQARSSLVSLLLEVVSFFLFGLSGSWVLWLSYSMSIFV